MLVGPYANGKTSDRRTVRRRTFECLRDAAGVGGPDPRGRRILAHFYASILRAFRAPAGSSRDVGRKAEQVDHLLDGLKPRILIFDEFHNALRGRSRDVEAVLAFLASDRPSVRHFAGSDR